MGVEGEIVADHPGGLGGRHLRHHADVVEDAGDVVEEKEEARGHGGSWLSGNFGTLQVYGAIPTDACNPGSRPPGSCLALFPHEPQQAKHAEGDDEVERRSLQ